jgi:hypothetical protein
LPDINVGHGILEVWPGWNQLETVSSILLESDVASDDLLERSSDMLSDLEAATLPPAAAPSTANSTK